MSSFEPFLDRRWSRDFSYGDSSNRIRRLHTPGPARLSAPHSPHAPSPDCNVCVGRRLAAGGHVLPALSQRRDRRTTMSGQPIPVSNAEVAVTRVEVIDHIGQAFAGAPLTRSDLLAAARLRAPRPQVLELLGPLPDRRFSRPHELWVDLRDVPIEL